MASNSIGLELKNYQGAKSTLCTGCGHDSVTQHIINAYFKSGVHPFQVVKLSGIGCSSKTTAYFMNPSHGFNSIHGRMASVATGAKIANHKLKIIGISGDGDTASIGLGGFVHLIRRNIPMVYIIENNGVYGLTKGQFSATADSQSVRKKGDVNPFQAIDLCALAIEAGCEFVARSFSGDAKQLVPLIQAAIEHNGTAVIDVISPCITYANHEGSTKSYDYVREHKVALQELQFILETEAPQVTYAPGESTEIKMANGSTLFLRKLLAPQSQDPTLADKSTDAQTTAHDLTDAAGALKLLHDHRAKGEILTGLFYHNSEHHDLCDVLKLPDKPLAHLNEEDLAINPTRFRQVLHQFK
jgi:2-oxoglutarate ferredoxin oxidoreductase subunit beta